MKIKPEYDYILSACSVFIFVLFLMDFTVSNYCIRFYMCTRKCVVRAYMCISSLIVYLAF